MGVTVTGLRLVLQGAARFALVRSGPRLRAGVLPALPTASARAVEVACFRSLSTAQVKVLARARFGVSCRIVVKVPPRAQAQFFACR